MWGTTISRYATTSHVEGAEALPHSLRILLENVLRNVDDADARELLCEAHC